jgi:biopolymer transport protein TolR
MQIKSTSSLQSDINVTPFVDVCLVLLIIFMVTVPLMVTGMPVHLPKGHSGSPIDAGARQLPITVNADATIYIDANVIRREQLAGALQRMHDAAPDRPVLVHGDAEVKYREIASVVDACRSAGFKDVSLAITHD